MFSMEGQEHSLSRVCPCFILVPMFSPIVTLVACVRAVCAIGVLRSREGFDAKKCHPNTLLQRSGDITKIHIQASSKTADASPNGNTCMAAEKQIDKRLKSGPSGNEQNHVRCFCEIMCGVLCALAVGEQCEGKSHLAKLSTQAPFLRISLLSQAKLKGRE